MDGNAVRVLDENMEGWIVPGSRLEDDIRRNLTARSFLSCMGSIHDEV